MKKLICILVVLIAGYAVADQGFVNFQNVTKSSDIKKTARFARVNAVSGPVTIQPTAACNIFINATTLSHSATKTGYPMAANSVHTFNINRTSTLGFTCASTAGNVSNVYLVR